MLNCRELNEIYYRWVESSYNTELYIDGFNNILEYYRNYVDHRNNSYVISHKRNNKVVSSIEPYIKDNTKVRINYVDGSKTVIMIKNMYSTFGKMETSVWDNLDENTEFDLKFIRMGFKLERT